MASGFNKVILIGNVGRDAELIHSKGGTSFCKLSLATSESRKVNGEWETFTEWHRVTIFGDQGVRAADVLKKGTSVLIEGKITYGSYEKDGVKIPTADIIAHRFQVFAKAKGGATPAQDEPENLPF